MQEAIDLKQREADLAFHKQVESKKGLKGFAALKGKANGSKGGAPKAAAKPGSAKSTSKARKKASLHISEHSCQVKACTHCIFFA